uniref:serine protease FAM111A-like n=1 Tax=Scatophagus argus TaxID=75038 RepID=UPI001ED861C2|nr:serine protease FAM111A-like [Scatophagus argus]
MLTCNRAGTIEASLRRSVKFRKNAEKNKSKELVIVREGKAISSHFPCSLIKNERLTIKYIKAEGKQKQSVKNHYYVDPRKKGPSDELVMFHVLTRGGKDIKKIMKNPELKSDIDEITVYAYKGEKVSQALKRDGRFLDIAFKKDCELSDKSTEVTTEMSNLVDDLNGATFKIILLSSSSPPHSQSGSLDDAYTMQQESHTLDGNPDPLQEPATAESVRDTTPKEEPDLNCNVAPEFFLAEIPNSKKIKDHLLKDLAKWVKTQPVPKGYPIQDLFRVEYGKSAETCREVRTMKKLMELSDSVCHVRTNGTPLGSGFLLFDKFVLTNGHVIRNIYNKSTRQLYEGATVHFSFESLDQVESGIEVKEVAGFEYDSDESGHKCDWALLRLGGDQRLPDGLLAHFGFLPQNGGICIIGHPHNHVKKIDPCWIVPLNDRKQAVERHRRENEMLIQMVTQTFFEDVAESVEQYRQVVTYNTCFYFGSSGSPVFDEHCNVIAMHTGGYHYPTVKGGQSVIEYGHPLSVILERVFVQLVEKKRFDVLQKYLAYNYAKHQNMMINLRKLVQSRYLTIFQNASNNSVVTNDEHLKVFFEFLLQLDEPVPMATD